MNKVALKETDLHPLALWKSLTLLATACFVYQFSQPSQAVEALSTEELADHCSHYADDPEGVDAIFCVHYIQGFIDGAVATDETVMNNVLAEYQEDETFTERALRTRSPSRVPTPRDPSYYAEYCLGNEVPLKEVVEHVIADLTNREVIEDTLLARDAIYAVLKRDYACKASKN